MFEDPDASEEIPLPEELTPEERKKAAAHFRGQKKTLSRVKSVMLDPTKARTPGQRAQALFEHERFSPLTELLKLCKIEGAKVQIWEKAVANGDDTKFLPKPNHARYIELLRDLVKYELPLLKSIDLTGKIDVGMSVQLVNYQPEDRIIEIDGATPERLRLKAAQAKMPTLPGATVKLVDAVIGDLVKKAVEEDDL